MAAFVKRVAPSLFLQLCVFFCFCYQSLCVHDAEQLRLQDSSSIWRNNEEKREKRQHACANDAKVVKNLQSRLLDESLPDSTSGIAVDFEIWVQDLIAISEADIDLQFDAYVNEQWLDKRLHFDSDSCNSNVTIRQGQLPRMWMPQIGFLNSRRVEMHEQPNNNQLTIIYYNGTVTNNYRARVKIPCDVSLTTYPFGEVACKMVMASISYNRDSVRLRWGHSRVAMLTQSRLVGYNMGNYSSSATTAVYPSGYWDELEAKFEFKRLAGWHVIHFYAPTTVLLVVNWASVGLGLRGSGTRMLLHAGSILACMIVHNHATNAIPRVNYFTAADVWLIMCVSLLVVSILEISILNCFVGGRRRRSSKNGCGGGLLDEDGEYTGGHYPYERFTTEETTRRGPAGGGYAHKGSGVYAYCIADIIDKAFGGLVLPITYIAFNVWYWITYSG